MGMETKNRCAEKCTYASTNGPGYGSDFWYKLDNFKLNIIAGKNSTMHAIIPAHNPFCN